MTPITIQEDADYPVRSAREHDDYLGLHTDYITKDSGEREEFPTGSRRDTRAGKGRFDLIPPGPMKRLAGVFERGSAKYGENNWQRGQPLSRYMDSALRHIFSYMAGDDLVDGEDHLAQGAWNLIAAMWTEDNKPSLVDLLHRVQRNRALSYLNGVNPDAP